MHTFLVFLLSLQLVISPILSSIAHLAPPLLLTESEPSAEPGAETPDNASGTPDDALAASISAPSAILMEASTGTIVFEKDSHSIRHPASITKIMTLILIFEALKQGNIHLTDTVTVSEHAASMGGSQVFLEAGETQDVETLIKCISIASANDACATFLYSRHSIGLMHTDSETDNIS